MDTQPPRVARPVMYHQWNRIAFLHWRYPPELVQSFLPAGLAADTCDGTAWIGLTPFLTGSATTAAAGANRRAPGAMPR